MLAGLPLSSAADISTITEREEIDDRKESEYVDVLRTWILNNEEFYGRTDEDFIVKFLRGCKYNLERTKRKIAMYYETRRRISKWWANRDLTDERMLSVAKLKVTTVLKNKEFHQPCIIISKTSQFVTMLFGSKLFIMLLVILSIGPNLNNFDIYATMHSVILETALRRQNCQLNGIIWIIDFERFPTWLFIRMLSPLVAKDCINSFYSSMPVRITDIHVINANFISYALWRLIHPFLTQKMRKRVHFYGSDWASIRDRIPNDLLPEEYGGHAGPMYIHEDLFLKEMLDKTDYFLNDNQYGYRSNHGN